MIETLPNEPQPVMLRCYLLSGDVTTIPSRLPPPIAPFLGRAPEIQLLRRRLLAGPRLVFLTGPGGIGKATLARSVAHEMSTVGYFGDGVLWVDGREVLSYGGVLDELTRQLGQRKALGRPLEVREQHLAQQISVHDYLLVVTDLDALSEGRRDTVQFMRRLPGAVLVTSRLHPPGLDIPVRVSPLGNEASHELLQMLCGRPLPVERTATLLRMLDGSPLAIHLVAALLAESDIGALEEALRAAPIGTRGLSRLQGPAPSTLRALLVALRAIGDDARRVVETASCLGRSFTAELVAHILDYESGREVRPLLNLLHQRGLMERTNLGWRLHNALSGPIAATIPAERMQGWHRRAAEVRQHGALESRLLAAEHLRLGEAFEPAARLLVDSAEELIDAGMESQLASQLQNFSPQTLPPSLWQRVNECQGDVAEQLGRWWEAGQFFERALMQLQGTRQTEAHARDAARLSRKRADVGLLDVDRSGAEEAQRDCSLWLHRADRVAPEEERRETVLRALLRVRLHQARHEADESQAAAESALQMARDWGLPDLLVDCFRTLGALDAEQGRLTQALAAFDSALARLEASGQERARAELLTAAARIHLRMGNWVEAIEALESSIPLWREVSLGRSLGRVLYELSTILIWQGAFERAQRYLQEAHVIARRAVWPELAILARSKMAETLLRQGDDKVAAAMLDEGLHTARDQMLSEPLPLLLRLRAAAAEVSGGRAAAMQYRRQAEIWARRNQDLSEGYRVRVDALLADGGEPGIRALIDELPPPMIYERARLQAHLAERLIPSSPQEARILLVQASDTFARLGARPDIAATTALRRQVGL